MRWSALGAMLNEWIVLALVCFCVHAPALADSKMSVRPIGFCSREEVLFVSNYAGSVSFLRLNLGTRAWDTVCTYDGNVVDPVLSPDGTLVAFAGGSGGNPDRLCLVSLSEKTVIDLSTEDGSVSAPRFSPNGDKVAYAVSRSSRASEIKQWEFVANRANTLSPADGMYTAPLYTDLGDTVVCARLSKVTRNSPIAARTWHRFELVELSPDGPTVLDTVSGQGQVGRPDVFSTDQSVLVVLDVSAWYYNVYEFGTGGAPKQSQLDLEATDVEGMWGCPNKKEIIVAKWEDTSTSDVELFLDAVMLPSGNETRLVSLDKILGNARAVTGIVGNKTCDRLVASVVVAGDGRRPPAIVLVDRSTGETGLIPVPTTRQVRK